MTGNFPKQMLVAIVALALPSAGQVTRSHTGITPQTHLRQARIPYTAAYKTTRIQTLANGTTITREDTETRARDSQGRQMNTSTVWLSKQKSVTNVSVIDPVAHTFTHWNSQGNRATVAPMPGSHTRGCVTRSTEPKPLATRTQREKPVVEDLGTESIQGIEAHGTRTTTTIPAGEIGNDVPLDSTFERWVAVNAELGGLTVREIIDEPRSGKSTKELTSFTQGDPDPALFQPPAGYEILAEEVVKDACPAEEATREEAPKE
jgi:hypothetical protein